MRSIRTVFALPALAILAFAASASAHVTVQAPGAAQGGFTKLTFRVPTEKDVPTTKLQIVFPADAPLGFVSVKPHLGWSYKVVKAKLKTPIKTDGGQVTEAVSTITWTATAGGIKPGEFDEFEVSAGPLPKVDQMVFKALQTYSDGDVVRWIEPRVAGGDQPEHPAPVLKLAAAAPAATPSTVVSPTISATPAISESSDDEDTGTALGAAGLAVGAVALLLAFAAFLRSGRKRRV